MGGKSTYLRRRADRILAQMGSFVPARSARLTVVDRVFHPYRCQRHLARGRSTFIVEMTETAAILHTATHGLSSCLRSGPRHFHLRRLAIAWAAIEYLHARVRAKTLFATHYFELTDWLNNLRE